MYGFKTTKKLTSEMAEFLDYGFISSDLMSYKCNKIAYKYATPNDRNVAIKALRNLINTKNDNHEFQYSIEQDDRTLLKFLFAKDFVLEDSFELLKNFYWYRKRNPELFHELNLGAEDIRRALENGLPGVLKDKDRKSRSVLILSGNNWDCSFSLLSIYRAILFSLDQLTNDMHNQGNGFVFIVDWTEFTYRQTAHLKPSVLRLMIEGLQDCFPAKIKEIHFIGQPWYVDAVLAVTKPFLKDEIKEQIYSHGNNLSTLHELVHKDILPAEFGGEKPSYNPRSFLDLLENQSQNNAT